MIIGITGGFGCGKSTVLELFQKEGAEVFSADRICHEIYAAKDEFFVSELKGYFGDGVIGCDGSIDRKFIASRVFSSQKDMDFLNSIFKKPLHDRICDIIQKGRDCQNVCAIEIPLLFEEHYEKMLDRVLTVFAPIEARKTFLGKRGFDFEEMQRRDARQMSLEEKVKLADFVIVNGASQDFLYQQFKIIWNIIVR